MNIQDEAMKIHSKYGTTEKANYEIQLLCEKYAKEYHEQQLKILNMPVVTNRICHKANTCAHTPGGCICPKNVICPL